MPYSGVVMIQEAVVENSEVTALESILVPVKDSFISLKKGDNLIVEIWNQISLLKYENFEVGSTNPLDVRVNRHTSVFCIGNLFSPNKDDPYTHKDPAKRIVKEARTEILGTHRLDFKLDKEFGIYLPSAEDHTDLYLRLAKKFGDGRIENCFDQLTFITEEKPLLKRLKEITRPEYFKENVLPFLENRLTNLEIPKWHSGGIIKKVSRMINSEDKRRPAYGKFNISVAHKWLNRVARDLEHGDFVYVGSKEEVYLLGIAKEEDGNVAMQGTYTTSTKPMLWFSNNYLGHMNRHDMERPLFKGEGSVNVAVYRTSNAPGFSEEPFIFTAMGREQCCKNTIFTGEPDIITGNLDEALTHFRTTDFKEFEDVVREYAYKIKEPTPNAKHKGDVYFY